jgi:hypothetical protein
MSRRPSTRHADRQRKRRPQGSHGGTDRTEARVQQLTAERDAARAQLTDLRLREAVARTRAEALQTEVERLKGLLEAGLLKHVMAVLLRRFGRDRTTPGLAVDP